MFLEQVSPQHVLVVELTTALLALHSCQLLVHLVHVETQGVLVFELLVTGGAVYSLETVRVHFAQVLVEALGVFESYATDRTGERRTRGNGRRCEAFQVIIQPVNDKQVPIISFACWETVVTDIANHLFSSHSK